MTPNFLQSEPGTDPLIVEGVFKASQQRMFEAWTTPADILNWFGPGPRKLDEADIDLQIGGAWRFAYAMQDGQSDELSGAYTAIEAPNRLIFSWVHTRRFDDGRVETSPPSQVTVTFKARDDGTLVRLLHEGIQTEGGRNGVGAGWQGTFARLYEALQNTADLQV